MYLLYKSTEETKFFNKSEPNIENVGRNGTPIAAAFNLKFNPK